MEIAYPVIEIREHNLFVLKDFDGSISENEMNMRHNLRNNRTTHLFDSNGTMWTFNFQRSNNTGIRALFTALAWNISTDYYSSSVEHNATINQFREVITPHSKSENPDTRELADALLESIESCAEQDILRSNISLLNL